MWSNKWIDFLVRGKRNNKRWGHGGYNAFDTTTWYWSYYTIHWFAIAMFNFGSYLNVLYGSRWIGDLRSSDCLSVSCSIYSSVLQSCIFVAYSLLFNRWAICWMELDCNIIVIFDFVSTQNIFACSTGGRAGRHLWRGVFSLWQAKFICQIEIRICLRFRYMILWQAVFLYRSLS